MTALISDAEPADAIDVLLATFNGARYLDEQIDSILAQRSVDVRLLIRDDGSTDDTTAIIRRRMRLHPDTVVEITGVAFANPAANFLALLHASQATSPARWFAFADQDDLWFPDKLARAIAALRPLPQDRPGLYGSASTLVDTRGRCIGRSPRFRRPPAFANALVQNIAAGNTMVMNRAAAALIHAAGTPALRLHDWWCYQLVTACGGTMIYDDEPSLLYRQHDSNVVGSGAGWTARLGRWSRVMDGGFRRTNRAVLSALSTCEPRFTVDARRCLAAYRDASASPDAVKRLRALAASGVYRQSRAQDALLWTACAMGKL